MEDEIINIVSECDEAEYMTIEEFSEMVQKKPSTIKARWKDIPGVKKVNGSFVVMNGTRYPVKNNFKARNSEERRYHLLRAIYENKYIDATTLGIYQNSFKLLLKDLIDGGYICENGSLNQYGANYYDCTQKGESYFKNYNKKKSKELVAIASEAAGTFVGSIISQMYRPMC